jgi:hypothetical protein
VEISRNLYEGDPHEEIEIFRQPIMAILKQPEAGSPVPELCREHGMSSATFYKWRSKYGGMDASIMS